MRFVPLVMPSMIDLLLKLMSFGGNNDISKNDIECVKYATKILEDIGCKCDLQIFGDTANVFAITAENNKNNNFKKNENKNEEENKNKNTKRTICFCGHCDVVPKGNNWTKNPCGEVIGNRIYGRGAVDMLGGNVAWIVAINEIMREKPEILEKIRIATLLTGAEEGNDINGTAKMVEYLINNSIRADVGIVGEPTSEYKTISPVNTIGNDNNNITKENDIDKNKLNRLCYGRGGSIYFDITVYGKAGHIAFVGEYDNPINKTIKLCDALNKITWENGQVHLEISSIDAKNSTGNVILDKVKISMNIRFFDTTKDDVINKVTTTCYNVLEEKDFALNMKISRVGYKSDVNDDFIKTAFSCLQRYNKDAKFAVTHGCTDGEYLAQICDSVCELGLKCKTMHQPDEYTTIQDLEDLKNLYKDIIIAYSMNK